MKSSSALSFALGILALFLAIPVSGELTLSRNLTLVVPPGGSGAITSAHLQAVSSGSASSQITYTLISPLPAVGHVKRDGQLVGWLLNPATGHYYTTTGPGFRTTTAAEANSLNGYLTSIANAAENLWLTSSFSRSSLAWIGLNDPGGWDSGESLSFVNWYGSEPNSTSENYVQIYFAPDRLNGNGGTWNDLSNTDRTLVGIVEKNSASGIRSTFTQEDIDQGRITYSHFSSYYSYTEDAPDHFAFNISDNQGNTIGTTIFHILTTTDGSLSSLVIQPGPADGKDTFCSRGGSGTEGRANNNHGAQVEMVVGQTGGSGQIERSLIQFDLSGIPPGAFIQSAVLKIKRLINRGGTLKGYRLKVPWQEGNLSGDTGAASWQSRLPGVPWSVSGFRAEDGAGFHSDDAEINDPLFSQEITTDTAGFMSIPLNAAKVQGWVDGSFSNHGFMMKLDSEGGTNSNIGFATSESATAADRPSLIINYLTAPAGPEIAVEQPSGTSLTDGAATSNFGIVAVGNSSSLLTFTIRNDGTADLTDLVVTKTGADEALFAVSSLSTTVLAPGANTTFTVQFVPTGAAGSKTAVLHIASNDADENPFDITLTGSAEIPPAPPAISFSTSTFSVNQGATVAQLTLTRTTGAAAASVTINTDNGASSTIPPFSAAVAPTDYTDLSGAATTVNFAIGELSKTIPVTLIPKTGATIPNKRFSAIISNPTGGAILGAIATTEIRILAQDTANPTLTVTAPPATAAALSTSLPYLVQGIAGDAKGIDRVEVVLNGATPVSAVMGAATSNTSRPYSLNLHFVESSNSLVVTAFDLRGNRTAVSRNFTFTLRNAMTLHRIAPDGVLLDAAGTVAITATPAANATALTPATANANPKTSIIVPGTVVKLTATPKTGYVLGQWTMVPSGGTIEGNVLTFTMPAADVSVTAGFVVNPFIVPAGSNSNFYGVILPAEGTARSNATIGFLTGTLTATNASFSGRILIDGLSQSFAATFSGDGSSLFTVGSAKVPSLSFAGKSLTLRFTGGNIVATVVSGSATSVGTAMRGAYTTTTNKVPTALLNSATQGSYTAVFLSKTQSPPIAASLHPQGDGFATMTLSDAGVVTFTGTLADGTAITGSSALVTGNTCPVFAQLVTPGAAATIKGGSLGGTLNFNPALADSDVTGTNLLWIRPAVSQLSGTAAAALATQLYTAGWPAGITVDALGALYNKTANVQTTLGLGPADPVNGNAKLTFTHGKLTGSITKTKFNISANAVTKIPASDTTYTLALTPAAGAFSGNFTPNWSPLAAAKPTFKGILIPKGASKGGYGFFISNIPGDLDPESGRVTLSKP